MPISPHVRAASLRPRLAVPPNSFAPSSWRRVCSALVLGLSVAGAQAQSTTDAGQLLQNQNKKPPPLPVRGDGKDLASQTPTMAVPSGTTIVVKRFVFSGNTLLDDATLRRALGAYIDRPLDFRELQEAAAVVGKRYSAAGRLARSFLPPQEIVDGVVKLQIVEASFGGVQVERSASHVSKEQATAMLENGQKAGEAVDLVALERALLLVGDLPGVKASASLVPGSAAGQTAVALSLEDKATVSGDVNVDNAGTRSTGETRVNASLQLNGALGFAEAISAQLSHNQGSDFGRAAVNVPLGAQGLRLGANGSALRYRLVGSEFAALNARGRSTSGGLDLSYPVLRTRDANLLMQLAVDSRKFNNRANGSTISDYSVQAASLNATGNLFDDLGGGGSNSGFVSLQSGKLDLDGSPSQPGDALGPRTDGHFSKVRYQFSRVQSLGDIFSATVSFSGQWASRNLDSSEKFYLGGPQGVRAYPVSEGGASIGQLLNFDLMAQLGDGWRAGVFADLGHGQTYVDSAFQTGGPPNTFYLKGFGLSLGYSGPMGLYVSASWARRSGDNPLANALGRDQDGSLHRNRFWLQAGLPY